MRNTIDMTALGRSAIGFERMFDLLRTHEAETNDTYPPCNIEKLGDDHYRIALAVAGFAESDLAVTQESNLLTVTGTKGDDADKGAYLYRGIAGRAFTRQFSLADYVRVRSAKLSNGLLTIDLERELPEAMKPRRIAIASDEAPQAAQTKRAA
jgi:molecular chaperone IbpA